jgi:hypothetical protein
MTTKKNSNIVSGGNGHWTRTQELVLMGLHDLKSPLAAMRNCIELLSPGRGDEESRARLGAMLVALIGRATGLLDVMMAEVAKSSSPRKVPALPAPSRVKVAR